MSSESSSKVVPVASGVVVGALIFSGLNLWFGRPFIPSVTALPTYPAPAATPAAGGPSAAGPAAGPNAAGQQVYATACTACHQATGQGLPGAFPPLAASAWVTGDAETPIRIVLSGMSGPIEVAGAQFNSMMPPPAGLTDQQIADVLTYVRSSFGNAAGAVDAAKVTEVRAALSGRSTPWTAQELTDLRPK